MEGVAPPQNDEQRNVVVEADDNPLPARPEKRGRRQRSKVWGHFTIVEGTQTEPKKAKCNYCGVVIACDTTSNGTGAMNNHLNIRCKVYPYGKFATQNDQKTLSFKQTKGENEVVAVTWSVEGCRLALAKMLIIDELPFSFVEGRGFKYFCGVVVPRFSLPSRFTVARDCLRVYMDEKEKLKNVLKNQRVCLTTDTWTSIQNLNYMVLTGHWVDDDWKLQKRILNFCQVSNHKGETIGRVVEKCLIEWGIESLFTVTVDNAASNNTTIEYLKRKTKSWKTTILNNEFMHMRCSAHILNLIVKDGLKESNASIEMIRNAVRYVRSSPHRLQSFKTCVKEDKLETKSLVCLDVPTRWNSTYLMLEAAAKFESSFDRLREVDLAYRAYFRQEEGGKRIILGPPSESAWKDCHMLIKFLKIFYLATLKFSGSLYVTSNQFFEELVSIQKKLFDHKKCRDFELVMMAESMQAKFDKYWDIKVINMALYISLVLDPRFKMRCVRFCLSSILELDKHSVEDVEGKVKDALTRLHDWHLMRQSSQSQDLGDCSNPFMVEGEDEEVSLCDRFHQHLEEEGNLANKSEVDRYLAEECVMANNKFDILSWWKINSLRYPVLSHVARDVLAIPVSSVASESAFSTGKRVVDPFRSSLSPSTIEALICAQDWLRSSMTPIDLRASMDSVEEFERIDQEMLGELTTHPSFVEDFDI